MEIRTFLWMSMFMTVVGCITAYLSRPVSFFVVIAYLGPAIMAGVLAIAEYVNKRKDEKLQRRLIVIEKMRQLGIDPYSDAIWEYIDIDKIVR